jgi:hypothetical protein
VLLNFIYRCKTDIGKLLVFWLEGQKGQTRIFSEDVLFSVLHLEDYSRVTKARGVLREAFDDAKQSGYLTDWWEEKRANGRYFCFVKSKVQIRQGQLIVINDRNDNRVVAGA